MPLGPNDNKQYGAQDFERYYSGQMSAQEMHALEMAALEDAFLSDALEGYKAARTPVADTAWLRQQLEARTQSAKVVPIPPKKSFPFLRIAALVLLLLGAGWSVYYLVDSKKDTLALDTQNTKEAAPQKAPAPSVAADTATTEIVTLQQQSAPLQTAPTQTLPTNKETKATKEAIAAPPVAAMPPSANEVVVAEPEKPQPLREQESRDDAAAQRKEVAQANALQDKAAGIALRKAPAANAFQGRVVDQNNQGVPYASVQVLNSRTATSTDASGYFSLNAPDTTVTAKVNAVGYEAQNVTLNNRREETNIVLRQSNQNLEEVVVTGYGNKRNRSAARAAPLPEPARGWKDFENYVTQNRKPAKELSPQGLTGSVTLSFDVSRQGIPTNIKVDSSLSPRHDEEAIRLLREGPKWERKKNTRGKVTINFE